MGEEAEVGGVQLSSRALGTAVEDYATLLLRTRSGVLGTIEVGKLANLVVVSGNDLFASCTPIKHVFVEGRLFQ